MNSSKCVYIFFLIFALLIQSSGKIQAQSGWVVQTQIDTTEGFLYLKFNNVNFGYISGRNGAVYITTNAGLNWFSRPSGVSNHMLGLLFLNQNTGYGCGQYGMIIKTTNQGISWSNDYQGFTQDLWSINFFDANSGFITGEGGKIRVTTNSGNNWFYPNNNTFNSNYRCSYIFNNAAYISSHKSTNRGVDWFTYNGMPNNTMGMKIFSESTFYSCSVLGKFMKTTNGGQNWDSISVSNNGLWGLSFADMSTGYIAGGSGVFKTTNGGLSWNQIYTNPIYSFRAVYAINKDTVYAAGYNVASANGILLKTTTGGNPVGVQPISNYIPQEYGLHQNYPNPFNPKTNIEFDIKNNSFTKLYIYDILGRVAKILVQEELKAGRYKVDFDAGNLSSGLYFYRLEVRQAGSPTKNFTETKKMMVVK